MNSTAPEPGDAPRPFDPYAVMRPRRGAAVALALSAMVLVAFTYAAITVPGREGQKADWGILDRTMIFVSGAAIAWFIWRFASIRATPSPEGIVVRNLLLTRTVDWTQIVRVQYGGAAPWARLDLSDADTVAVMAIQKADGAHAQALAARLAALVEVHSSAAEPEAGLGPRRGDG
ncbi:PH domain-containing protein [Austwickia chelonae]|uniref:PH domain-containing protein n=1 Tax=Austwickia chelonae TaxID=100225 RepID=UPI00031550B6|nr:PH domain-containing protein [Austwickia chelonae]